MTRRSLAALLLPLSLAALQAGCGSPVAAPGPPAAAWSHLEEVPHPELGSAEAAARQVLEAQRLELAELLTDGATTTQRLGKAFGRMGRLYHAYHLRGAAAACYRNARRLLPQDPDTAYAHGLLQAESGELSAAAESFAAVLATSPGDAAARLRRGEALLALGLPEEAQAEFEQLVASGRDFAAAAHFGLARSLDAAGKTRKAVEHFARVHELAPEAGAVRYPFAQALLRLGEKQRAREVLAGPSGGPVEFPDPVAAEIHDLAATSAALRARAGEALIGGRLEEAEELYRRAVRVDPASVEARRNLALALIRAGRAAEAVEALEAARRLAPDDALVHLDLANALLARGDLDSAVASFRRALEVSPDLEMAHFNLANALMEAGRWQEAEPHLRRVLELSPENLEAAYLLAMARYQQGRQEEGIEGLRQVLEEDPGMMAARRSLASIHSGAGRIEEARRQYVAMLERSSTAAERADAYVQLALLSLRRGALLEAEGQLREALEISPADETALAALGDLLLAGGRAGEAAETFRRWAETRPDSGAAQLKLAESLTAGGRFREAAAVLEVARERNAADMTLVHALARLLATARDPQVRDGARALELAQQAYLAQRSLERAETVAMAMAEQGDLAAAARWQLGLLEQARGLGDRRLVQRIAVNLRLYEAGEPVRLGDDAARR